jgi:[ribosomal protein S5]-alanine N-acetyltransferase
MTVPPLDTPRLQIRPFILEDLEAIYQILDVELGEPEETTPEVQRLAERQRWLEWTVLSYEELARLHQPPYGERAIALKETGQLIGACGYAPCLNVFDQIPALRPQPDQSPTRLYTSEVGLYWAISPRYQKQGYATEVGAALINYGFIQMGLRRIVATTNYDNRASQAVMLKLGMRLEHNPEPDPPWLQVVGILDNPKLA